VLYLEGGRRLGTECFGQAEAQAQQERVGCPRLDGDIRLAAEPPEKVGPTRSGNSEQGPGSAGARRMSPPCLGTSGYLLSHQSSHLLACLAARSGKSRISRMTRVGFCSS
jgi:hypothetical protein